jgi:hypothetical protein
MSRFNSNSNNFHDPMILQFLTENQRILKTIADSIYFTERSILLNSRPSFLRPSNPFNENNNSNSLLNSIIIERINPNNETNQSNLNQSNLNPQTLENNTTFIAFRDIPQNEKIYNNCPISLNEFNENSIVLQINHCKHYFSPNYILHHFRNNNSCPYCRFNIQSNLSSNSTSDTNTNTSQSSTQTVNSNTSPENILSLSNNHSTSSLNPLIHSIELTIPTTNLNSENSTNFTIPNLDNQLIQLFQQNQSRINPNSSNSNTP